MTSARRRSATARRRAASIACSVALAAGLALGACGDDDSGGDSGAEPLGEELAGSVAPLAQCRDWNTGSEDEKLATIEDIRSQVNLESSGVSAPPLSDEEALEVFDSACSNEFAQSFRLYVVYARAAGFAPLTRDP